MDDLLQVGAIASTHGIKGEVNIFPTTDDANRFKILKEIILDTGKEKLTMEIEWVKFMKKFVILKFKGIDTINDVEKYKGKALFVTRDHAVKCEENEYFIADLIGLAVMDDADNPVGTITDVLQTGANDVYVVLMADGKEVLFPAIKECILKIDMESKMMTVHVMDGLME